MAIFLKKFENHTQYEQYINSGDAILPNVSICTTEGDVHYNPLTPPTPTETRLVCKYNVEDTEYETALCYDTSNFSSIEIDGIEQPSVVTAYTFDTVGEHTVKYALTDPTSIGESAFQGCYNLTSIVMPNSVTSIGNYTFMDCSSFTSVNIPSGVTSIGEEAFSSCSSLTSIDIPNSVTSIGNGAFNNCSSLTSIDIPNSVTSIGNGAFGYCSFTSCTIGSGVTSIGNNAFSRCRSLTSVTVNVTTPPTLEFSAFYDTNDCPIYVPSESVETYKSTSGWSDYASRIQAIP
jgi:hypothetical protein